MKQQAGLLLNRLFFFGPFYLVTLVIFYMAIIHEHAPDDSYSVARLFVFCLLIPIGIKFLIQLIATCVYPLLESLRAHRFNHLNKDKDYTPLVSVLVPAWNEEVGILKTISSILRTNYQNVEVVVINDGSTDQTHNLVSNFIKQHVASDQSNINIQYLSLENGGKAKALNQALQIAKGEFIFTIDADSMMDESAITNMVKRFTSDDVAAVAGNVIVGNKKKPIELLQQLEYLYGFFFKRADSNFNSVYIIGGAAAAYRKSVLLELNGFDENIITEDIEMSTRILAHGYKTRYAADSIIYTEGPSELKGLCNQRLRWKYGRLITFMKHRKLFFNLRNNCNPYLTCLLLPLAVYAEFLLLLEGPLLALFYGYTILTSDYVPLAFVAAFMSVVVTLQVALDPKAKFHLNLILLAPIAWILFYVVDLIEFQALTRSLKRLLNREGLEWQKWVRVGVTGQDSSKKPNQTLIPTDTCIN